MKYPWMPFYVGDYRSKTAHLSTLQHGAYLLLILHYWATGQLPEDDASLARIAGMTPTEWRKNRPVLSAFFRPGWKHKRIDSELKKSAKISRAGRKAGIASAKARRRRGLLSPSGASQKVVRLTLNDRSTTVQRPFNDRMNDSPTNHSHTVKKDSAAEEGRSSSREESRG